MLCPVLHTLFRDPVFVVDSGNTYEREAILGFWASSGVARDPLSNIVLPSREVRTNWGVRRNVQDFLDAHPDHEPEGWDSRELLPPDRPLRAPPAVDADAEAPAAGDLDDGMPRGMREHCRAVANSMGGHLKEEVIVGLVQAFGGDADLKARLRQEFGQPVPPDGEAVPPAADAEPQEGSAEWQRARVHLDAVAQAHGGTVPDPLITHFASVFQVDEAILRTAYPRR